MSTSVPPRDGGTQSKSPSSLTSYIADESALRRAFDAEYSACIVSAQSQLGDAASQAPRVVETAFANVWSQRAKLGDAAQFKAFLTDQVKHGSARALSRRASVHRFGNQGHDDKHAGSSAATPGVANAEQSWAQITHTIHGGEGATDSHAAVAAASRHGAAVHMKGGVEKRTSWVARIVLVVLALAVTGAGAIYLNRAGEDEAIVTAVNSPLISPLRTTPGQIGNVSLSDGTKMRIGADTKVSLPDGFPNKMRALQVAGTAQFEVAPNQKLPFHVVAKRAHIIATGTSFGVSAYPNDSAVTIQVKEGSVSVKFGNQSATVGANQTLLIDATSQRAPSEAEKTLAFGWLGGRVAIAPRPLREVNVELARWFNRDVQIPAPKLLDRTAAFDAGLDSSNVAISQIEKSANVKFAYEGQKGVFRDATGAPATPAPAAKSAKKK